MQKAIYNSFYTLRIYYVLGLHLHSSNIALLSATYSAT